MKKIIGILLISVVVGSTFCTSSRKVQAAAPVPLSYADNIQHIMTARCAPCHMPGGNKKQYASYAAVKGDIDDIIRRVQLNPGEKGYMPMRHPKLTADTINLLVQWKAQGLLETKP